MQPPSSRFLLESSKVQFQTFTHTPTHAPNYLLPANIHNISFFFFFSPTYHLSMLLLTFSELQYLTVGFRAMWLSLTLCGPEHSLHLLLSVKKEDTQKTLEKQHPHSGNTQLEVGLPQPPQTCLWQCRCKTQPAVLSLASSHVTSEGLDPPYFKAW